MIPPLPEDVAAAISTYPASAQERLIELRLCIHSEAARQDVGPLIETLKWGEPAWLTKKPKTGSTIRIAWKEKVGGDLQFLVNCKTNMIEQWRAEFPNLIYAGNRAIHLPLADPLPMATLRLCIAQALTYHTKV